MKELLKELEKVEDITELQSRLDYICDEYFDGLKDTRCILELQLAINVISRLKSLHTFLTKLSEADLDLVEKGLHEISNETYSESYEDCDGYLYYDTIDVFDETDGRIELLQNLLNILKDANNE